MLFVGEFCLFGFVWFWFGLVIACLDLVVLVVLVVFAIECLWL